MAAAWNSLTVRESLALMEQGRLSSRDLVESLLDAIRARDPAIGGYLDVDADEARRQADAADARRRAGGGGRLLGVPLAVKDVLHVRGQPCRCASRILDGYRALYDATAVARLRAEGALFLGRTNMDEFAMGSTTENSAFQATRNPWDLARVPGGSSGGSAAVVAADEALAALGSDTGGSVRQPAAFCGCVGLKPTYGRISRYGLTAFASSFDQVGPITKDVADAALLLGLMAGRDPLDSTSLPDPVPDYTAALAARELRGLTLGLPAEYFGGGMHPDVELRVREAAAACERLGARLVEVRLPRTAHAVAAYYVLACAEASSNLARFDGVRFGRRAPGADDPIALYRDSRAAGFGLEVKRRIILGTYVLSRGYYDAYYLQAQKVRTLIRRDFEDAFRSCQALLAPVTPTAAYRRGEKLADPLQMYLGDIFTVSVNLAGICALSVPCGLTGAGLPVGLQIIGPSCGEALILRIGQAFGQTDAGRRLTPPPSAPPP